jgi:cytochrome c peroxidase
MKLPVIELVLLGVVMGMTFSCRKDKTQPYVESIPAPTPYSIAIPSWIASNPAIGELVSPIDNPLTIEGVALGRELFYEPQLSGNSSMSCGSCHFQKYAFSDPAQFSQGIDGDLGDRQAMALINLAWEESFFWDARSSSLEDQAYKPVVDHVELNDNWINVVEKLQNNPKYPPLFEYAFGTDQIDSTLVVKAIAQFERTLISFDSEFERIFFLGKGEFSESEEAGRLIFFGEGKCNRCHFPPLFTDKILRNNGLDASFEDLGLGAITGLSSGNGKFKVPTLRNIAQTGPYMHDGRFSTLMEVLEHYNNGVVGSSPNLDPIMSPFIGGLGLSDEEILNLHDFLLTLTDSSFLAEEKFSNPN